MTAFIENVDVVLDIFHRNITNTSIGQLSKYSGEEHPGTNKKIQGWQWDRRNWPTVNELKAIDYAPSIYDPVTNFISSSLWQTGIGDGIDLLLLRVSEITKNNKLFWLPEINHGHFYLADKEWYLYSDDVSIEDFYINQTSSTLQYKDLSLVPKPGIPLKVRRFRFDRFNQKYSVDLDLRKKLSFTGEIINGVEQETVHSNGNFLPDNIDSDKQEFVVDYDTYNTPRLWLNKIYSEEIGNEITLAAGIADPVEISGLEQLGSSDGFQDNYYLEYSPVDPSGVIQLWDYTEASTPILWTELDGVTDFTDGSNEEFKLDYNLGIVSFGDFNASNSDGAGKIPAAGRRIAMHYTKGIAAEYEPINSRDSIRTDDADLNALHNASHRGFLQIGTHFEDPAAIILTSTLASSNSADISLGNKSEDLIATVTSNLGNPIENQQVTFEIIGTANGQLSNNSSSIFTTLLIKLVLQL